MIVTIIFVAHLACNEASFAVIAFASCAGFIMVIAVFLFAVLTGIAIADAHWLMTCRAHLCVIMAMILSARFARLYLIGFSAD
jgi:hypothetical protein